MPDGMLTGVIIASVIILIKVLDYFLEKAKKDSLTEVKDSLVQLANNINSLTSAITDQSKQIGEIKDVVYRSDSTIAELSKMHQHFDDNGLPLWFIPRDWQGTQTKIVELCGSITDTQKDLARALEAISNTMTNIDSRITNIKS